MVGAVAGFTTKAKELEVELLLNESVTVTLKFEVPATVGVP